MTAVWKVLAVSVTASMIFWPALAISKWTGPDYEFQYNVHSHMENTYFSYSPEIYIESLVKCKQGMMTLGLTNDTYGKYWSWEKTPDWRMDFQYRHIDGLILRGQELIQWRENNNGTPTFTDVYNQKMQNIRNLLKADGDWSDDIAREAFWAQRPLYYFAWVWVILNIVLVIGLFFLVLVIETRLEHKLSVKRAKGEWTE